VKLKNVSLENFRSKASSCLELGSRLTLLIGENGTGKTTFLDAIAIALGEMLTYLPEVKGINFKTRGDIHQQDGKPAPYTRIKVVASTGVGWDRMQKRDKSKRTAMQIKAGLGVKQLHRYLQESILDPWNLGLPFQLPVIVQYGVKRAWLDYSPVSRRGFPKVHSRFESLADALNSTSRFRSALNWFYNKENEESRLKQERRDFDATLPELNAVRRCITTLFPNLSNPRFTLNPLRFVVSQDGEELEIDQLSDGYKTMLGLAIDLSWRMAGANPHLEDPLAAEAIVMIDEVDLHLHPAWQQRVVSDLLRCFPNTQFILTTHSSVVVEGINNLLKRFAVDKLLPKSGESEDWTHIRNLYPLDPNDTAVYQITRDSQIDLMDREEGLTADTLIDNFNDVSHLYDLMRDLEWETLKASQREAR
jgi:predicted ATP-binding protein involved in virulence